MRNRRGAAKWLKVVLIVSALCLVSLLGLVVFGVYWMLSVTSDAKCIQSAASSFMTISDPLPGGFRYFYGFCLLSRPYVRIISSDQHTIFTFSEYLDRDLTNDGAAEKLIASAAEGDVPGTFGSESRRRIAVVKKGTLLVGKQNMPYVLGQMDGPVTGDKSTVNTFIGAIRTPGRGKLIVLMVENLSQFKPSLALKAEPFPLTIERVRSLTDGIESFK